MGFADIGYQGMVYVGKNTPHMKLLRPFLEKKKVGCPFLLTSTSLPAVGRFSDAKPTYRRNWQQTNGACDDKPVCHIFDPFEHWFLDAVTSLSKRYPQTWTPATHIGRLVRDILLSVRRTSLSSFSALRGSWAEQR